MSGYRHCITETSADRQRQFETALLTLLGQTPWSQISIQDICGLVGLSRKSFYRYFSSKEACLEALVDHTILAFTDLSYREEELVHMLEKFFLYWNQNRSLLDALCRNSLESLLYQRVMVCSANEYGIRSYLSRDGISYEQSIFFISGLFGLLMSWHAEDCRKSPGQMAAALVKPKSRHPRGVF